MGSQWDLAFQLMAFSLLSTHTGGLSRIPAFLSPYILYSVSAHQVCLGWGYMSITVTINLRKYHNHHVLKNNKGVWKSCMREVLR